MKLRLTDNTYVDTGLLDIKYNVNVPLFTYWLHDAEFKELHGLGANETDPLVGAG